MDDYKNGNNCISKGRRHRLKKLKRLHRILQFDIFSRERPSAISEITRSCYRRWRMSRRGRKPAVLIIIVIMRSWLTIWVVSWTQIIIVANIKWTIEAVVRCSLRVIEVTAVRIIYVRRGNRDHTMYWFQNRGDLMRERDLPAPPKKIEMVCAIDPGSDNEKLVTLNEIRQNQWNPLS